ncbi:hypothetical protein SH580_09380 [Coraliomargarita algicola]|uniref:Uncharacterized protein n=1 Tax=Coraliomargarita algicola TaxID=3092156 RepID=A0ABZ0RP84_9BACT|nr:hypothetical protein [Coraliomargarita sp. J2-16]WPJ97922.1 hypothetical protein SH580_09380 [Coraliomargarita sp. J2-16]
MFYRRDIEDKKRPKPMRSFSPDAVFSEEAAEASKKSRTLWFMGAILLMLAVVVAFIAILKLYYDPERGSGQNAAREGHAERMERRFAEQLEAARAAEASRASSVPDAYELLSEPKLLQAYLSASGGRDALFALETLQYKGRVTWQGQMQFFELLKLNSNLMRLTLEAGGATTAYGHDGQAFWQSSENADGEKSFKRLSLSEQEPFFECRRFFDPLMAYALRGEGTLQVIEFGEWQGKTAVRVQLRGGNSNRVDVFVDPKTLRVRGMLERVRASGEERSVVFSDFQSVDGYYIPFSRRVSVRGELVYDMRLTSCDTNVDVSASVFRLPEELVEQTP